MTKKAKLVDTQIEEHVKSLNKFCNKNNVNYSQEYDEYTNLCATHLDAGTSLRL